MSKLVDEAVETLRIANDKMAQLSDAFCENAETEPPDKPYLAAIWTSILRKRKRHFYFNIKLHRKSPIAIKNGQQ